MIDQKTLFAILDSLKEEYICFVDTEHIVRYMNQPAVLFYDFEESLIGSSIFRCHNEESKQMMLALFSRLQAGEDEILFTQGEEEWKTIRAVRDPDGKLLGYYERFTKPES